MSNQFYDRPLPHDLAAERALIGVMLSSGNALREALLTVEPAEFYGDITRRLCELIINQVASGNLTPDGLDPIVVRAAVRRAGIYPEDRSDIEINYLCAEAPYWQNWKLYADAVRANHQRRLLCNEAWKLHSSAQNGEEPHAIAADAITGIGSAVAASAPKDAPHFADFMKCLEETPPGEVIPTQIAELDNLIGGLTASHLIVIAARSGVGKTSLMGAMVVAVMDAKHVAFVVSAEMTEKEVVGRLASAVSGVPSSRSRRLANCSAAEIQIQHEWAQKLTKSRRLLIWDTSAPQLSRVLVEATIAVEQRGAKAIFIDYLSKIQPPAELRRYNNRQHEVAFIIEAFKDLAKRLRVPVVVLVQINRQGVEAPRIHHLKESGQIEQAADSVIIMHVEDAERMEMRQVVNVVVDKNRHGPTGEFNLYFDRETTRYSPGPPVQKKAEAANG